jgi:hypothetical protein
MDQSIIPPPRQLALGVGEEEPLQRVWDSLPPPAREHVLRLLAVVIARVLVSEQEELP